MIMNPDMSVTGMFMGENGKMVSGTATISNGKLMLSNFKTEKGPDLHVYLTKDGDIASGKSIAKIDLENTDQTFSLNGIDTTGYNKIVIYCNKAHVIFGSAKLM
ncbi:DM13 domain-containing protein [Heyndrickxia sp. NPDC080065]|uniref:DM13 domain-containing protein n=1 Tax=Heyndrickxia sp. NPDC080065 TaxID=3390568 RepID=UPI003D042E0B